MKSVDKKSMNIRIIFVGFLFGIFFAVIGAKAVYLQVFQGPWLSHAAAKQYEKSSISRERRGTIYDSRHREIAVSIDVKSIGAFSSKIKDVRATAQDLARIFNSRRSTLSKRLASGRQFVWIKRQVTPREAEAVKNLKLEGIEFITELNRYYPNRTLAAQLLGFTGVDGYGLEGIEFFYDTYLKGTTSKFRVLKDALGRGFDPEIKGIPLSSGNNLILTIDQMIQYITEKALESGVKKSSAKTGMAVVMVPGTGAILALANYPFFNPNSFNKYGRSLWRNRVITDSFEPGSTLKVFTMAAALESGLMKPDTPLFVENGKYNVGNNVIHDAHSHDWLTLRQIIKFSSNIGAVKISERIGPKLLYQTLSDFGFGAKIGIDCPGETTGSLSSYRRWSQMDTSTISFGQGISVSAIQLITAVAAIAHDGILMRPYVVQAITDENGGLVKSFGPDKIRRAVSPTTARSVSAMMQSAIEDDGTGVNAALDGYSVCGKTGTAQKIDENGTYSKDKYVASFVGFTPAEKPEVVILVVIDEPAIKAHHGGAVAAPVFRKIALDILHYMNIPPRNNPDRLAVSRGNEVIG